MANEGYPVSPEMLEELGAMTARIFISEEAGGFLFTYGYAVQNHGWYADGEGKPFSTLEAALAVANDPESENLSEYGTGTYGWSI